MSHRLRFVMVLHQHQPVGNLDAVNDSIYRDCYLPLLETLRDYPTLPVNLHVSGSLIDWLAHRRPEYLDRLREMVAAGRIEIMGGAYHDPILPMLGSADRRGQIESLGRRLGQLFGQVPRGMWLPERVWEPSLAADMADCDIEHMVLDDYHFHAAGLSDNHLRGYYLTEAEGRLVALFSGDERLRYLIPFAEPHETIQYLRETAETHPGGVMVYADDAEKFGAWPGMRERMQNERWLRRLLDALVENASWLKITTLGETIDHVPPQGKVYIPEGSYREMGVWSTLAGRQPRARDWSLDRNINNETAAPVGPDTPAYSRPERTACVAGTWRNFRVRYPEIDEMYCRMLMVSRRCQAAAAATRSADGELQSLYEARQALYRAQCGCAYWHGVYGGVYQPHLRQAVYRNLIEAERLLDETEGHDGPRLVAQIDDFNLDVHKELLLSSDHLTLLFAPDRGGQLYELDVREIGTNLLATLARRPEPYHPGAVNQNGAPSTTSADNDQRENSSESSPAITPIYDQHARKSLLDHFYDLRTTLDEVAAGTAAERGDFLDTRYRGRLRRVADSVVAQLSRTGRAYGQNVTVTKELTLSAEHSVIDIRYELSGLPPGRPLRFAVEFNFAGLPPACPDRYFVDGAGRVLADFGRRLDLTGAASLRLVDRWLGLDIGLSTSEAGGFWAFPVQSLSRSQRGLETIQQSIAVLPYWTVVGDLAGRWSVELRLSLVMAASGMSHSAADFALEARGESSASQSATGVRYLVDGPHATLTPHVQSVVRSRPVYEG